MGSPHIKYLKFVTYVLYIDLYYKHIMIYIEYKALYRGEAAAGELRTQQEGMDAEERALSGRHRVRYP